jgi:asparagine synthase (glutamine-hydrolysing)
MPNFLGIWSPDRPTNAAPRSRACILQPNWRESGRANEQRPQAVVVTKEMLARGAHCASVDGVHVLIAGQPKFIKSQPLCAGEDIGKALIHLYGRVGMNLLEEIVGHFALAIVDEPNQRALLGIDRFGVFPLSYSFLLTGELAFGCSTWEVAQIMSTDPRVARQAVFDFMHFHMVPSPATAFIGVQKLPPASCAVIQNGQIQTRQYWKPQFAQTTRRSFASLKRELHEILKHTVVACDPDINTGTFLSGGLDSSSIVGKLADVSPNPVSTFSVGFQTKGFDELHYARLTVERFDALGHEEIVSPSDIVELIPKIAEAYDEPFGNSSALPTYVCARMAKEAGMNLLLAGDGGDELFAGNPHYMRHQLFEQYRRIPVSIRKTLIESYLLAPSSAKVGWPIHKFRSYVNQAKIPLPMRLYAWNYVFREKICDIFSSDFLANIDQTVPQKSMQCTFNNIPASDTLGKLLAYDWKFVLADSDLRKVRQMCELAGIRVKYPMLDSDLIDFSLAVPNRLKMKRRNLRYFYKKAMEGFLPKEIIQKQKHGFGLPFGVWLRSSVALRDMVQDTLSSLRLRGIFQPEFLHAMRAEYASDESDIYGSVIWDLLILEHWLQVREVSFQ